MSYNNSEISHLWANSSTSYASGSNFFFENECIYSYGYHYLCGFYRIINGEKVYFVNNYKYSNTTAKHMGFTVSAIPAVYRIIRCELYHGMYGSYHGLHNDMTDKNLFLGLISQASERYIKFCKMMIKARTSHDAEKQSIENFKNDIIDIFGTKVTFKEVKNALPDAKVNNKDKTARAILAWIKDDGEVFENLFEAVNGFASENRSAMIAKEREQTRKRNESEIKKVLANLKAWHNNEAYGWRANDLFESQNGWHTALRLSTDNSIIETSKGIKIENNEMARLIWKYIKLLHNGALFTHNVIYDHNGHGWKVNSYENDILTAGCHKIPYSECERVAKTCGWE